MEKTDAELVQSHLEGDKEALKMLVSRYAKPVYTFVFRLSGNADEATDITQETFVKAWKNFKKYDPAKKFSTWIFTIARNTSIDWLRKRRPLLFSDMNNEDEGRDGFGETIADEELLQHELFERKETELLIEGALRAVPVEHRTIILLHTNEGLTFEEIATIMKKPMNTVKSQYRRALGMMKKHLEKKKK